MNLPLQDRQRLERLVETTGLKRVGLVGQALERYEELGLYRRPRHYASWQEAIEAECPKNCELVLFIIVNPDGTVEAFGG